MTSRAFIINFVCILWLGLASVHAQTSALFYIEENGPRSERINIVFLSEGYMTNQMASFRTHAQNAANYLFSRDPWKRYRPYCNVYAIEVASNQSGTDNGAAGGTRDTYFHSGFNTPSITQLLTISSPGPSRAYSLLNQHVPEYDVPVVLVNDTKYGGSGGSISVASVHSSSAMIVEHEVGHSFAGLADEYDTYYAAYTPTESYNATQVTNRTQIRWKSWVETSTPMVTPETGTYANVVGAFEGAMYRTNGWYRPHYNSVMRNLGQPVGQVNREKFVLSIYNRVSPIDSKIPSNSSLTVSSPQILTFSVTPKAPATNEGPRLSVQWLVNGLTRSGATNAQFILPSNDLGNGSHTVTARITDTTTFVRDDPGALLIEPVTWNVSVTNHLPVTLAEWRATYGSDSANPANDGFNNLVKYALGLNPLQAYPTNDVYAVTLMNSSNQQYLALSVFRTVRRTDIQYTIQSSGDLTAWGSGAGHTVLVEDSTTKLQVRDAVAVIPDSRRFLKFGVSVVTP
jgi:hypothetical protein